VARERPGDAPTTAIRAQRPATQNPEEATTAIPTPRPQDPESTEKLNTRDKDRNKDKEERRRGTVSAQDLLRREGRL
jgi:hypothetical protein